MTWKASWQVYGQAKHWSTFSREGRRKTKSNSYRRNKKELCYCKSKQSRLREAVLAVQAKSEVYIIPLTQKECAAEWTAAGIEHNKALNWELEKNHLGLPALGKKNCYWQGRQHQKSLLSPHFEYLPTIFFSTGVDSDLVAWVSGTEIIFTTIAGDSPSRTALSTLNTFQSPSY